MGTVATPYINLGKSRRIKSQDRLEIRGLRKLHTITGMHTNCLYHDFKKQRNNSHLSPWGEIEGGLISGEGQKQLGQIDSQSICHLLDKVVKVSTTYRQSQCKLYRL